MSRDGARNKQTQKNAEKNAMIGNIMSTDVMSTFIDNLARMCLEIVDADLYFRYTSYTFKALPKDLDIARIAYENRTADFILVQPDKKFEYSKRYRIERYFILLINKSVLDIFDHYETTDGSNFYINGESLDRTWGHRYSGFTLGESVDVQSLGFRGVSIPSTETSRILKELQSAKKELYTIRTKQREEYEKNLKSARNYSKEDNRRASEVAVKVF